MYRATQRNGRRFSAASAFLEPALNRPNLTLVTCALVLRVLMGNRRVVGVAISNRENCLRRGKIILCGGAISAPQLLMLSGIGPGAYLQRTPRHPRRARSWRKSCRPSRHRRAGRTEYRDATGIAPTFLPRALRASWAYRHRGQGEFTSNVAEAGGFVTSDPTRDRPNPQFHFIPGLPA